ncbi:MAG TPA: 16S rRNA (adenine(1518)-N(6)/adenine(1519)-N(6))-dimethyltransferase RsmA [Pyrinomonadaceae bacterium]|nr:16S rRNA (adenine(1518)-N(6)/adenine(1519)-N(6))-dimethyltransferase RsmA [Pyrinomonadaceae bacterium]
MRAKKSLGQNFLREETVIGRIVNALELLPYETVIEIGPGRGALTEKLIETGAEVVAVEIDRQLVPALRVQFHSSSNFTVIEADVMETDLSALVDPGTKAKLVANLPYYISTAILQKLIVERQAFSKLILMLQREVADRISAAPGNSDRGFLTVLTEAAFDTRKLMDVPPEAFTPAPKVWSSVIELTPKQPSAGDEPDFRRLVSAAFEQKRKTILNNLKRFEKNAGVLLSDASIDPKRRAETLSLDEWLRLYARSR